MSFVTFVGGSFAVGTFAVDTFAADTFAAGTLLVMVYILTIWYWGWYYHEITDRYFFVLVIRIIM